MHLISTVEENQAAIKAEWIGAGCIESGKGVALPDMGGDSVIFTPYIKTLQGGTLPFQNARPYSQSCFMFPKHPLKGLNHQAFIDCEQTYVVL